METKKSVAAAISAAVYLYLEAEQQAIASAREAGSAQPPRPLFSPWVLAGRQASMEIRRMWQMRLAR